jgi:hypothetical protein
VWRAGTAPGDPLYADGLLLGTLALLIGAVFDAYHLAGQLVGVFALLIVATIPNRPFALGRPAASVLPGGP